MNGKTLRDKLIGSKDERAVSPVIGVILMVAITVILAAVIAAFVLDLGDSVDQQAQAGVNLDIDESTGEIQATWTSEGNSNNLDITVDYDIEGTGADVDNQEVDDDLQNIGVSTSWDGQDLADESDLDTGSTGESVQEVSGTVTATATIDGGATTVLSTQDFTFEYDAGDIDYSGTT